MESRKIVCLIAAIGMGVSMLGAATIAEGKPAQDVVVKGKAIDPELQRAVSYADLNLAFRPGQKILASRINRTANSLCWELNPFLGQETCRYDAVRSTDQQVAAAIERAKRRMAGLPTGPAVAISMVIGGR